MRPTTLGLISICTLVLNACGGFSSKPVQDDVLSAISGIAASTRVRESAPPSLKPKPSAAFGLFASSFLSQGTFSTVQSATKGIDAQMRILTGHVRPDAGETFALLTELAGLLQADIPDLLNRSTNRSQTFEQYTDALRGVGATALHKRTELKTRLQELEDERSEERTTLRKIEKDLKEALRKEDYALSASFQKQQTDAQSALAETESHAKQLKTILSRYEHLIEISRQRLHALEQNREVLVTGLRVIEVPGIRDLSVLEEGSSLKRLKRTGESAQDIFGREKLYTEE